MYKFKLNPVFQYTKVRQVARAKSSDFIDPVKVFIIITYLIIDVLLTQVFGCDDIVTSICNRAFMVTIIITMVHFCKQKVVYGS